MQGRLLRWQAAAEVGVAVDTFSSYVARGHAPAPVEYVGATPLWDADEIAEWKHRRPGRPGRPRRGHEDDDGRS